MKVARRTILERIERARELFAGRGKKLRPLAEEARRSGQSLRVGFDPSCHMDGVFDKMLCKLHLPEFPLRLLLPDEVKRARSQPKTDLGGRVHWLPRSERAIDPC
jgi:hypothetical protein